MGLPLTTGATATSVGVVWIAGALKHLSGSWSCPQCGEGLAFGHKRQGHTVVAKALARRSGPVIEHMPVVPPTARTVVFGARVDELVIGGHAQSTQQSLEKTGPTCAALVFVGRAEQGQVA